MDNEKEKFFTQFDFRKELAGCIGIERERFLRSMGGLLVPRSREFLECTNDDRWTYELSACQVEDRTRPCKKLPDVRKELENNDREGHHIARNLSVSLCTQEVAEKDIPLEIYPDERYLGIGKDMPREVLEAACRVTGTHIHIGMSNLKEAVRIHNALRSNIDEFCQIGDHSDGERLRLYKVVAPNCNPLHYHSADHFFEVAKEQNFVNDPRNCWHLMRISVHGTVELRMFGVTEDHNEILSWVELVRKKLKETE